MEFSVPRLEIIHIFLPVPLPMIRVIQYSFSIAFPLTMPFDVRGYGKVSATALI